MLFSEKEVGNFELQETPSKVCHNGENYMEKKIMHCNKRISDGRHNSKAEMHELEKNYQICC